MGPVMDIRLRRARWAVSAFFALNGALFASLFARLPAIQDRTGLSAGELSLSFLCATLALFASQVVAGALVARVGSRPLVLAGGLGYSLALVPVALSESLAALAAFFAVIGFMGGTMDVAMNVHGLTVERGLGRPILSRLHAAFSFGALAGAGIGGIVAGLGVGVVSHLAGVAVLGTALTLAAARLLLPPGADATPGGPMFAVPTRALALIGAFIFCAALAEGAVNDWVAVYLAGDLDSGEGLAAAGLAAFSLTMAIGRLAGDRLAEDLGPVRLGTGGAALGALGIGLALATSSLAVALVGFGVAGFGAAALFPLALRAAAERGSSPGPSVAAVSAMGYGGFLAGPPAVGGLAELGGLRTGLVLVAVLFAAAALLARGLRPAPVRFR